MYLIELTENAEGARAEKFVVTKKAYQKIEVLSSFGGFRRYNISLVNDGVKGRCAQLLRCSQFIADKIGIRDISKVYKAICE